MGAETSLLRELFFSRTSDFLDTYLVDQCNKSEKTRESYRDALSVFRRYAEQTGRPILNFRFRDCTYGLLLGYKEYLAKNLGYGPSSVNHRLAALKSYARYAYGCDPSLMQFYITVSSVPLSSVPKIRRKVLDEDAVSRLLDQPPATGKGLRDTLIMSILFDAAIRLDELIQLKVGDIYQNGGYTYLLIHGKGNKERKVSLDDKTKQLLDQYMKRFHPGATSPGDPLFYTILKGKPRPMSHRNVQKMIRKYSDNASKGDGEPFSAHPHMLRRSRACNLYQNDTPIEVVSVFLGHSSIETTKDHYAFPSIEQMRKAMESGNGKMPCRKEEPLWEGHEDELARLCGLR